MSKLNFYTDNLINSVPYAKTLISELSRAKYVKCFESLNIVLVLKGQFVEKKHGYIVNAYSVVDGTLLYEVKIPEGYFPLYFTYIATNNTMGMVCKPNDKDIKYAIECTIDKDTGKITFKRELLCTEKILIANWNCDKNADWQYPVANFAIDKDNNIVSWTFNSKNVKLSCEQEILEALYCDFQETILTVTQNSVGEKQVKLYNLDGSYRLTIQIPQGFELLSHPPCFYHSVERYTLTLLLYNPQLSIDALLYMIIPDNGDLVYKGISR